MSNPSAGALGRLVTGLVAAYVALLASSARAATPAPAFPSDRVAVAGVADTFRAVRNELAEFRSAVDASYHVAVIENSHPQDHTGPATAPSAVDYADQLFEAWRPHLDPARHVLIVLAIENRGIAIHPGSRWVEASFEGAEIKKTIDASSFGVFARAGDYSAALLALVRAVDVELVHRRNERVARVARAEARLARLETSLGTTRGLVASSRFKGRAEASLAEAQRYLDAARAALGAGRLVQVEEDAARGEQEIWNARGALDRARTELLLAVLGALALALLALTILVRRHLVARERARLCLQDWEGKLAHAGIRLLSLSNRHPLLFGSTDLGDRLTGRTREHFLDVGRQLDDLFLKFERAQAVSSEARALTESAGWLKVRTLRRVPALLSTVPVTLGVEPSSKRRLFLPEREEVQLPAADLLEDMDARYEQATRKAEEFEAALMEAAQLQTQTADLLRMAERAVVDLESHGLEGEHWRALLIAQGEEARAECQRVCVDPLGTRAERERLVRTCEELRDAASGAAEAARRLTTELSPRLEKVRADLRVSDGKSPFDEPGFDVGGAWRTLVQLERRTRAALVWSHQGWSAPLKELADKLVELEDVLPRAQEAEKDGAARLEALRAHRERLLARAPGSRSRLDGLRATFAEISLEPFASRITATDEVLQELGLRLEEAERSLADGRWLTADSLLRGARELLDLTEEAFAGLERRSEELELVRAEAQAVFLRLEEQLRDARAAIEAQDGRPSAGMVRLLDRLTSDADELRASMRAVGPDWPTLRARVADLRPLASHALEEAHAEGPCRQRAEELTRALTVERACVGALLAGSAVDRPPANQSFERACALLDGQAADESLTFRERVDVLQQARPLLQKARKLARDDFDVEAVARQLLTTARQWANFHSADREEKIALGRRHLEQAELKLQAREYEEALREALHASDLLVPASLLDDLGARNHGPLRDHDSRAVSAIVRSYLSSQKPARRESLWTANEETSSGSWLSSLSRALGPSSSSGSSSGRSFFGSSSGRSSFGSSSGGSSFGSSSGGSSFGSSSGGSSW
jgi:hypothetical protein